MIIEIGHRDLIAVTERENGFGGLSTGRFRCTPPWSKLQRIGLSTANKDKRLIPGPIEFNVDGPVELNITGGGIRNHDISPYYKAIFRKSVLPAIKNFVPTSTYRDSFKLILIFKEILLFQVTLVYTDSI
jgi:hypothetical protein